MKYYAFCIYAILPTYIILEILEYIIETYLWFAYKSGYTKGFKAPIDSLKHALCALWIIKNLFKMYYIKDSEKKQLCVRLQSKFQIKESKKKLPG